MSSSSHFPVVAVSADDLKLREQELRENFILEDRKLKEKLEYQRKVEDEAKQMALAKGTTNEAAPIKVEESTKPVVVCSQRTKRRRKKGKHPFGGPRICRVLFPTEKKRFVDCYAQRNMHHYKGFMPS